MEFKIYVVWSLEDSDNVDIFLDKEKADGVFKGYEEFGCWEEKSFNTEDLPKQTREEAQAEFDKKWPGPFRIVYPEPLDDRSYLAKHLSPSTADRRW